MMNLTKGHETQRIGSQSGLRSHGQMGLLAVVLLSLFVTSASSAQRWNDRSFGRPGGYLSLGGGGATESFQVDPFDIDLGSAFTVGGRFGYRANPYVAMEAAVDYTASGFDAQVTTPGGTSDIETRTVVGTANVKLYPGGWRVSPFVMGGAGAVYAMAECQQDGATVGCGQVGLSDSETEFAGRFGGGLDVYLTRNIALTGEVTYVMPTGNLGDFRFVTYGGQLLVRF